MTSRLPVAPPAHDHPLPLGTAVTLDPSSEFVGDQIVTGGHPWRVLRLNPAAMSHVRHWEKDGTITAGTGALARTLTNAGFLTPSYSSSRELHDVTIVIPHFGDVGPLRSLIEELGDFAVIVVDDGSPNTQELGEICNEVGVRLIHHEHNRGPAAARNTGLQACTTPFVWFIDSDVTVGGPRAVWQRLSTHFSDPLVAAVAPRVVGHVGASLKERFEERWSPLDLGPRSALATPRGRVSYVPSASLIVRRSAIGDGFDEELRTGEDVDLIWRLAIAGWLTRYDAQVLNRHRSRSTTTSWFAQRVHYGDSASALAQRHPGNLAPIRADAWTLLAWCFAIFRRPGLSMTVMDAAQRGLAEQLPADLPDADDVARHIAGLGIVRAGGPLARALLRSYAPLVLLGLFHRRTRTLSLVVVLGGVVHRLRGAAPHVTDIPLALADDTAYSLGLWRGAWQRREWSVVLPQITWRTRLGRAVRRPRHNEPTLAADRGLD